jgi:hypothetical protein
MWETYTDEGAGYQIATVQGRFADKRLLGMSFFSVSSRDDGDIILQQRVLCWRATTPWHIPQLPDRDDVVAGLSQESR